ncbi:MAG: SIS domain-containing protein [Acidimicrobiia bacterium]
MCGIVAFVRKPREISSIDASDLFAQFELITTKKDSLNSITNEEVNNLEEISKTLISLQGIVSLTKNNQLVEKLRTNADGLRERCINSLLLEENDENVKAKLTSMVDSLWVISKDACNSVAQIISLVSEQSHDASNLNLHTIAAYRSINLVLRSLDRIEVRGRDSAGISVCLKGINLDENDLKLIQKRNSSTFLNDTIRFVKTDKGFNVYFAYKRAAEIGELGDNVEFLRKQIREDELLFDLLARNEKCHETILAHTRWASLGVISEENTHPLDSTETDIDNLQCTLGVLNGDIDNHNNLRTGLSIDENITTDAKLIPVLFEREFSANEQSSSIENFRKVVNTFEGSTAVGLVTSHDSDKLFLALRGGGQGLFIGLGDNEYLIASEPYGVVEIADKYVRVDGETPSDPNQPITSRGQVFSIDCNVAGTLEGLTRLSYDGSEIKVTEKDVIKSEVTTRDIDRGEYEHYLWKEINDGPNSFISTLQGKFHKKNQTWQVEKLSEILPENIENKIKENKFKNVYVIGQGTAAVASQACSYFFNVLQTELNVQAILASEVSGFMLRDDDMSDTLVIAVSQSGTTTDTNRTVDLLKDRGARVIAIVNRRGSDLSTKADGVCYTSSGRDVEMSVASTKAFYAQVAAGAYLALLIENTRGNYDEKIYNSIIDGLHDVPSAMKNIISMRPQIAEVAQATALDRRSWATVGNGANAIAAREIRVKSSELCYKSIATDITEDKKHIDLSSEPLIVVCATGIEGSTADDIAKEVAIYKAHKACPVVITDDDTERFDSIENKIVLPKINSYISFILATLAGHIYGYESARAIDKTATLFRVARGELAKLQTQDIDSPKGIDLIGKALSGASAQFFEDVSNKKYDAILDASDATQLTKLFVALTPPFNTSLLSSNCGGLQTPVALLNCAVSILTHAIDELTRPIDAIRHQAKTVTVGISRSDDTLLKSPSVAYLIDNSISRDLLQFSVIRTLLALDEMVGSITGHTRYSISEDEKISVIEQKGSASNLVSRITSNSELRGTKHLVYREQSVWVTKGKSDGRNVVLIPEIHRSKTTGITLLHFDPIDNEKLSIESRKRILEGYKQRLYALRDAVTETKDSFDESKLAEIDIVELLTEPVFTLAKYWS